MRNVKTGLDSFEGYERARVKPAVRAPVAT